MESIPIQAGRQHCVLRKRSTVRRLAAFAVIMTTAVSVALAWEGSGDKPGLRGILPKEVPADLNAESFGSLTGNWAAWAKQTGDLVAKLYTDDKLDSAGQRQILKSLRGKIATIDRALGDPRYASLHDPLVTVRGRLLRRVDVNEALLDTLELNPEQIKEKRLKHHRAELLDALSKLESDLLAIPGGEPWLRYFRVAELRKAVSDGQSNGVVTSIEKKLKNVESLAAEQRQFLQRPTVAELKDSLAGLRRAEQTKTSPGDQQAVRAKFTALVAALEAYEDDGAADDARKARQSLHDAEQASIDEGDILGQAVRNHYMNYNLQVVASEPFLTKLAYDQRVENGPVRDFVLGADVYGNQSTTTTLTIDMQPGDDSAHIAMVLNGIINSSTAGVTNQATVYTQGYHHFGAVKELRFDGHRVTSLPAQLTYVQPSNNTTGADTSFGWIPILGGIANGIAVREAERMRPESEAIAAQRIASQALPKFDEKAEEAIQDLNTRLQNEVAKRLKQGGVYPYAVHARTNEGYMRMSSQVIGKDQLAGDVADTHAETAAGLVLHLHESLLSNAASHINLAGRTLNDDQIKAEVERYLSLLAGRAVKIGGDKKAAASPEDKNSVLIFDKEDPIHFRVGDGNIEVVIRAGFRQEGKDEVPTQIVTVPVRLTIKGNQLLLERGTVQVSSASATADRTAQVVRAGVMRKKIESMIQPTSQEATMRLSRPGLADMEIVMSDIRALNGWLTIWAN